MSKIACFENGRLPLDQHENEDDSGNFLSDFSFLLVAGFPGVSDWVFYPRCRSKELVDVLIERK
ncbi:MAG TPA: hypothetical protein VG146_11530 [Verrucomicrobiae bacterium]|nr:hypothetical protein [Verrucomicrobiae bacterium]